MSSNSKTSLTAQLRFTNTELELLPPDGPTASESPGGIPTMRGVLAMECTDPKCLSGTEPHVAKPVPAVPFELATSVQITQASGGQPALLAKIDDMGTVPIPVFDPASAALCGKDHCERAKCQPPCGQLCQKLTVSRKAAKLPEKTKFYVYKINEAPGELASLQDKLIAIPVLPGKTGNMVSEDADSGAAESPT